MRCDIHADEYHDVYVDDLEAIESDPCVGVGVCKGVGKSRNQSLVSLSFSLTTTPRKPNSD